MLAVVQNTMNIKLLPRIKLHSHPAIHRRPVGLKMGSLNKGDKFARRISSKLEDISEEYGTEEMMLGMISGLSQQASKDFNQQMDNSSLPNFMQDELQNTFKDECAMADSKVSVQCQIACNAVFEEHLSLEIQEGKLITGLIESGHIETDEQTLDLTQNQTVKSDWLLHRTTLGFMYEKMIFLGAQVNANQETDKKMFNWLVVMSSSLASLQCEFLQAAMDNLKTMQKNVGSPCKSQEDLDAMSYDDRERYHCQRNDVRKRFISAQSEYRVNLHLFSLTTQMLASLFRISNNTCQCHSRD